MIAGAALASPEGPSQLLFRIKLPSVSARRKCSTGSLRLR